MVDKQDLTRKRTNTNEGVKTNDGKANNYRERSKQRFTGVGNQKGELEPPSSEEKLKTNVFESGPSLEIEDELKVIGRKPTQETSKNSQDRLKSKPSEEKEQLEVNNLANKAIKFDNIRDDKPKKQEKIINE